MAWPLTLAVTDDLISAADWNRVEFALAEASGAAASYTFSSIPQVWTHLRLVGFLAGDSGGAADSAYIRFNGDSTSKYYWQRILGSATSVTAASASLNAFSVFSGIPGNESTGWAAVTIDIPNYAVAHEHSFVAESFADVAGTLYRSAYGGFYNVAAAITSLTISPSAGSFSANSMITLYGKGAV